MAKKKKNEDKIGLHIGCGSHVLDGWLNTDIFPEDERIRFLDATMPFPYEEETFKYIFCEHMFEHVPYVGGRNMLNECYRVLKPGGVLRMTMPTLNFLVNIYLNKEEQDNKEYIEWAFKKFVWGERKPEIKGSKVCFVINNFYRNWGHRMLYDEDTVIEMLENAGFKEIKKVSNTDSEYPELKNVNGHRYAIGDKFNDIESTTFEAKK